MGNSHRIIIALIALLLIALVGFIALDRYQPSESLRQMQEQQAQNETGTKAEKVEVAPTGRVEPSIGGEEKTPIRIEEPADADRARDGLGGGTRTDAEQSGVEVSSRPSSPAEQVEAAEVSSNKTREAAESEPVAVEAPEEKIWLQFQRDFAKKYANAEEASKRREIFAENLRFISEFNGRNDSFSLAINQFADLSREEINRFFVGPQVEWAQTLERLQVPPQMLILADQSASSWVDWRNASVEPANQANCLDSAAFAVLANIEVALTIQRRAADPQAAPLKLSLNHLLDCLSAARLPVCQGQLSMVQVFQFLQDRAVRLASERSYEPLRAKAISQNCLLAAEEPNAELAPAVVAHVPVHQSNLLDALTNSGPLSAAVDASQSSFHFYGAGLYHDPLCSPLSYNQHLLIVARSTNPDGRAQLIARNSFGPKWGELGHIRLLEDERNKCLPQNLAVYPNLAS